jgi:hypothetical protein
LLLFVLSIAWSISFSQQGYLFVKKGFHKKRTFTEGDEINLKMEDGSYRKGVITLLRNDTIFINGKPVYRPLVAEVILERNRNKRLPDVKTLLLIGAGAAITTAGLVMSKQADFEKAATASLVIGYGPLLIRHLGGTIMHTVKRKKFRIGKKFRLQVLDFHLSPSQLRSF